MYINDKKLNRIGDPETALSVSWFERDCSKGKPLIKILKEKFNKSFNNSLNQLLMKICGLHTKNFNHFYLARLYKGVLSVNARTDQ